MFKDIFIKRSIRTAIFLVIYTLLFALFFSTLKYTLPFVLGFAISLLVKPLNKYLKKKLPFSRKASSVISALLSTLLVFTILVSILSFSLYKIIDEIRMFVTSLPDMDTFLASVESLTGDLNLEKYYDSFDLSKFDLDLDLAQKFYSQISSVASSALNVTKFLMNKLGSIVVAFPMIIAIGFITFLSTYFFSKDMRNIDRKLLSIFTSDGRMKARKILKESKSMLWSYIRSYLYLMSLTFVETLIGLTILGVNYSIILSLITAVVDLLPVLGAGSIYIPMAIYFYFKGKTSVSIGLLIMFAIVSVVRQIAEPKLVSTNVGIHPLLIIASLFIGLKSFGVLGIIYFISTVLFYKILQKVEIL